VDWACCDGSDEKALGLKDVEWIYLAQQRLQWQVLFKCVI